ncbi:MAG TPA: substrate-binding domain-containing protein [Acidimicrobiales bacterium]|nr:substrate-binding domain-containing protein [Acidimicrobiales bacterium]
MSVIPARVLMYGVAVLAVWLASFFAAASTPAGAAATSPANGQGSTYAALAFQQWTQSVQNQGLNLNYTPTSSPAGLEAYSQNTADFAGTEAEFSELLPGSPVNVPRGFEYTPDAAGATAIMYNVALTPSGQDPISSLRLSPMTIAKIFLGKISNWDDPAISADNGGVTLPNQHITVVCRTGQSGTTALFYDFVAHTDPGDYASWAAQNGFSTGSRILEVDNANSPTNMACQSGSDTEANYIAANRWTIGYDEFGYAKVYNDNVAWVQNASGNWVQPYAVNISAALESAQLAPDTSQNLSAVYTSSNAAAYPISAYSYILVQCAPNSARSTCLSAYSNQGIANTLGQFMSFVACAGQIHMAAIGYAPLPPQLSQFLADAVGFMLNQPAQQLNASNCSNPTFSGSLGADASPPPLPPIGNAPGGSAATGGSANTSAGSGTASTSALAAGSTGGTGQGNGSGTGTTSSSGQKNSKIKPAAPAALDGGQLPTSPLLPLLALLVLLAVPVVILSVKRKRETESAEPHDSIVP